MCIRDSREGVEELALDLEVEQDVEESEISELENGRQDEGRLRFAVS